MRQLNKATQHVAALALPVLLSLFVLTTVAPAHADLIIGSVGTGAGQYEKPRSVAVDTSTGHVYVADEENNRVDVFDEAGVFLFAFGWKVNAEHPEEKLQTCTTASGCLAGIAGSGAGQFRSSSSALMSVAVDSASHDVYVLDGENHRVQKFDATGGFLLAFGDGVNSGTSGNPSVCTNAGPPTDVCKAGTQGSGTGQIAAESRIGIEGSGTVYVLGDVNRLQKFDASGILLETLALAPSDLGLPNDVNGFAVASGGGFYTASASTTGAVRKYDSTGALLSTINPSFNIRAIAVDPAGDLFVSDITRVTKEIREYNTSGIESRVFFSSGPLEERPLAFAFHHTATGDLYVAGDPGSPAARGSVVQLALPEPGPLLIPGSTTASPLGNVRATLKVEFNAENKASKAHFQYITKAAYEADGSKFGVGTQTTPESAATPADFENHAVSATNTCSSEHPLEATCLKPETGYYFRAIVSNHCNLSEPAEECVVTGEKVEFTTLPPLEIDATWATEVGTDAARLHAEVNPQSIDAAAHFEYVDDATYQADIKTAEEGGETKVQAEEEGRGFEHAITAGTPDFGSSETSVARSVQLSSLQPATTYHYRLLASDGVFPAISSVAHTLTTFALPAAAEECSANAAYRTGPSAALPDCRAYELVSPLDKDNGDILTRENITGFGTALYQSSAAGSGLAYTSYHAFAKAESAPYTDQYLAVRHERGELEEGWATTNVDAPRTSHSFFNESVVEDEYKAFTRELTQGWFVQQTEPALTACAPAGFPDLYRRESTTGAYTALSCGTPPHAAERVNAAAQFGPEIQGFSSDGALAVFRVEEGLTSSPISSTASVNEGNGPHPIWQVYEASGTGVLHLVSVLPDGEADSSNSSVGTALANDQGIANQNRRDILTGAVSSDGTRVFWSTGGGSGGPIYLRINANQGQSKVEGGACTQPAKACTIPVSATVSPTPQNTIFQAANPQGTKALFFVNAGPLKGNLYEFDSEAGPASHLIATGVELAVGNDDEPNILGASEDLSHVYYASDDANPSQQAEGALPGEANVYLYDNGVTRFVATLSPADLGDPYGTPVVKLGVERTARVSPDGSLAFMSDSKALSERTAGYDNTDAVSGEADSEVYLYDPGSHAGAGALRCVSCNPSGARPEGRELEGSNGNNRGTDTWAAASIPHFENALYQSRYISDDGRRVFFDSYEGLVLGDTNGKEDAYQWEQVGSGSCNAESPSYAPASEGCLSLLSSGKSADDSEFIDASASGADAFFTTTEGLVPQDPGLVDVYDARIDGGFAEPPGPPVACEGEACEGASVPPPDVTPASSAFSGPGSPIAPVLAAAQTAPKSKPKPKPCKKGTARKKGKCVKKKPPHRKQAGKSSHRPTTVNRRAPR
jgi:DNA-binding beta-propeller fold protein YncE